jgi:hypothetical protein
MFSRKGGNQPVAALFSATRNEVFAMDRRPAITSTGVAGVGASKLSPAIHPAFRPVKPPSISQ